MGEEQKNDQADTHATPQAAPHVAAPVANSL